MYDEKIDKILYWMEHGRPEVAGLLAGELFLDGGKINEEAKKTFEAKTGYPVKITKVMGMLGGYILAYGEKWYFA